MKGGTAIEMSSYGVKKCLKCGENFMGRKGWGSSNICTTCKQASCKHEYRAMTKGSANAILECRKCHHVKVVPRIKKQ